MSGMPCWYLSTVFNLTLKSLAFTMLSAADNFV